jgi:acyl-CoA thioesterase FadM
MSEDVRVVSGLTLKRKGAFIVFNQQAWTAGGGLLGQADITCACVDAQTMALMPAAPPGLVDVLNGAE